MDEYNENNIDWFEEEIVNEAEKEDSCIYVSGIITEDTVYKKDKGKDKPKSIKLAIHIDPDPKHGKGFVKEPYIKVTDDFDWKNAKNSIRINLYTGEIIKHSDGKGDLKITSDIKKFLNDSMDKTCNNGTYKNKDTVKEAIFKTIESKLNLQPNSMSRDVVDFTTVWEK